MSKWIKVEDELPPLKEQVICYGLVEVLENPTVRPGWLREHWNSRELEWLTYDADHMGCVDRFRYVSHWMKNPEPPNE